MVVPASFTLGPIIELGVGAAGGFRRFKKRDSNALSIAFSKLEKKNVVSKSFWT